MQLGLRAFLLRNHLPWDTLFVGTITSPAFILFTFFMITDPATSPRSKKLQVLFGFLLAGIDLYFHRVRSYYTFFYAGFVLHVGLTLFFRNQCLNRSARTLNRGENLPD